MLPERVSWLRCNEQKIVNEAGENVLLRGFGLGGWLLPEGYMWRLYDDCDRPRRMEELIRNLCGEEYARNFWESYFASYYTEEDIALVAQEGCNSVRLPFNSRTLIDKAPDGSLVFNQEMVGHLDRCLAWCKRHGVYLVLDMHGAPGGQTGTNIDDSANDHPDLFTGREYQDQCVTIWQMLAARYAEEPAVAGYDLMNEPLPEWFNGYNHRLMPLYRRIVQAIREVDTRHLIILEGVHWANDWSVFDELSCNPIDDNCVLQFHKYWNNPDEESMKTFLDFRKQLNLPIYMGEGGENTLAWYTGAFSLYERLNISWNFWTYKKMDGDNSPLSFPRPDGWDRIIAYLRHNEPLSGSESVAIFDSFLSAISARTVNREVFRAVKREVPITIPAEFFDTARSVTPGKGGADLQDASHISILFVDGHSGSVDYCQREGEPQSEDQQLYVELSAGESLSYRFTCTEDAHISVSLAGREGGTVPGHALEIAVDGDEGILQPKGGRRFSITRGEHLLTLKAVRDTTELKKITIDFVGRE